MAFKKTDYDFINLAVSIKGQADRLGIEHDGVPHEGVVASIAQRAVDAEARIAEAAKLHRPDWSDWGIDHPEEGASCSCGANYRYDECPTAVSLGLNEGENE